MIKSMILLFSLTVLSTGASFAPVSSQAIVSSASANTALTIHMRDSHFKPESASVQTGQTVVFVNDDEVGHTITAMDQTFNSGNVSGGKSWRYTFSKPGTYRYVCIYHPWMKGAITVTSAR